MSDLDRVTDRRAVFSFFSFMFICGVPSFCQMSRPILRAPRSGSDGGLCYLKLGLMSTARFGRLADEQVFLRRG